MNKFTANTTSRHADDPGKTTFNNIRAADLMKIRIALLNMLDKL